MEEKTTVQAEQSKLLELLKKLEAENDAQARYAKKQHRMACISAAASVLALVLVVVCVAILLPRVLQTFDQVDTLLADVDTILTDMESITSQMEESLPKILGDLNALVTDNSESIAEAVEKIASIDIDSLNKAIQDLKTVIEPLAKLLGR